MKSKIIIGSALLMAAQFSTASIFTDKDLLMLNYIKNPSLSVFLTKHGFPKNLTEDSAITFAESKGLLQDANIYGSEKDACKSNEFFFVKPISSAASEISKTISVASKNTRMSKPEYQSEWDKVIGKFGKPNNIDISTDIFPINTNGMIDSVFYKINHGGAPLGVTFSISHNGCLKADVRYIWDENITERLTNAINKQKPNTSISDALK